MLQDERKALLSVGKLIECGGITAWEKSANTCLA
jgi:hypothetical protein